MDLGYSTEHLTFRAEVQAFLVDCWTAARNDGDRRAHEAAFRRQAIDRGYLYRAVPKRYGGSEQSADLLKAQIIDEEFKRARAPGEIKGVGTQMLVPTLLECGEEWQRERFIAKTLAGDYLWCQGYSEPGAGSDLASLRTRAELVDDDWVINGQKVWTSHARSAHYMFALVRTEPDQPKHEGLSYLLLEMDQPGIEVRPLKQANGGSDFNEVFFADATTPASWIVGARGQGWPVSRSLLKHERNMLGGSDRSQALFDSLLRLAGRTVRDGCPAAKDPAVRDRLAVLLGYLRAQICSSQIQLSRELSGGAGGFQLQLLNKLDQTNFAQMTAMAALDLIGDSALLAPGRRRDEGVERWMNQYMGSLGTAIAGGASNIQRNIIAERGLGLPRDRQLDQDRA